MTHYLAQLNIGRLHHPLDAPETAEFVAALDAINLIAERSPGFVWRLTDDSGASSSYVSVYDDPLEIVNFSVWTDAASLHHYVHKSGHVAYLRRRREWFAVSEQATAVCWWIDAGTTPTIDEARRRLDLLRREGASAEAFPFSQVERWPQPVDG